MQPESSAALRHRTVEAPAGRLHLVEQGTGPLVLLVHGFP
ncbi:alpha/beta hydrolase, partial [Streptomyces sp. NPDC017936]